MFDKKACISDLATVDSKIMAAAGSQVLEFVR